VIKTPNKNENKMEKVELLLLSQDSTIEPYKVSNLIGITAELVLHSIPSGETYFAATENVRVSGEGWDVKNPDEIFRMLKRIDVEVYFIDKMIFCNSNWGAGMVHHFTESIKPII